MSISESVERIDRSRNLLLMAGELDQLQIVFCENGELSYKRQRSSEGVLTANRNVHNLRADLAKRFETEVRKLLSELSLDLQREATGCLNEIIHPQIDDETGTESP